MEEERLYDALEVCLAALSTGVDLEACLGLYPDLAAELRPVLEAASLARLVNDPDTPPAHSSSDWRLWHHNLPLRGLARPRPNHAPPLMPFLRPLMVGLLLILLASLGIYRLSIQSLPGDRLYSVKRAAENVQLSLSASASSKRILESDYNTQRSNEIRELLKVGRSEQVNFTGVLTQLSGSHLVVDGILVEVTSSAHVQPFLKAGMVVNVEGETRPGGFLSAQEVHLLSYKVIGRVNAMNANRMEVAGTWFRLAPTVRLDPELEVGDTALVLSSSDDRDALWADAVVHLSPAVLAAQPALAAAIRDAKTATPDSFQPFMIQFQGTVQNVLPGDWVIDGKRVHLSPLAEIPPSLAAGQAVNVQAWVAGDGSLTATTIQPITVDLFSRASGTNGDLGQGASEATPAPDDLPPGQKPVVQASPFSTPANLRPAASPLPQAGGSPPATSGTMNATPTPPWLPTSRPPATGIAGSGGSQGNPTQTATSAGLEQGNLLTTLEVLPSLTSTVGGSGNGWGTFNTTATTTVTPPPAYTPTASGTASASPTRTSTPERSPTASPTPATPQGGIVPASPTATPALPSPTLPTETATGAPEATVTPTPTPAPTEVPLPPTTEAPPATDAPLATPTPTATQAPATETPAPPSTEGGLGNWDATSSPTVTASAPPSPLPTDTPVNTPTPASPTAAASTPTSGNGHGGDGDHHH